MGVYGTGTLIKRGRIDSVMRLPELALKNQLTAYDAAYLELALRLKLPIATKYGAMNAR